jgi:hypothetical protein
MSGKSMVKPGPDGKVSVSIWNVENWMALDEAQRLRDELNEFLNPWIPLDPNKPGYRALTGADADEFGQVLYCTSFGKVGTLPWRTVAEDVEFLDGKWAPVPPGPKREGQGF